MGAVDQVPNVSGPMGADPDFAPGRAASGKPWALVGALLILLLVEIGLRVSGWPKKIPYELELDEYFAVSAAIDEYPTPDVLIVGSSRAREAIDLPKFRQQLRETTGKKFSVASYAVSGGRAYVIDAITQRVLREKHLPKIILFGGAERDLSIDPSMYDQASLYWNLHDWKLAWQQRGGEVLGDLPVVIRNYLGNIYTTLGRREQLRLAASHWLKHDSGSPGPIAGELTIWQINNSRRSIAKFPPGDVSGYARSVARPPFPNADMLGAVDRLAAACAQKHVRLIIFQVPIPRVLAANLPRGTETKYADAVRQICEKRGATFIVASELSPGLSDRSFRDTSHLNITGADAVGETLLKKLTQLNVLPAPATQGSAKP